MTARWFWFAAAIIALAACRPKHDNGVGPTGHIAANTTWSGTIELKSPVIVNPLVTLTVAEGTIVRFTDSASIEVQGFMAVHGSKGAIVHFEPAVAGGHFNGISVPRGGSVAMTYGDQVGGGYIVTGGQLTISDSTLARAPVDLLEMLGGTITISYSSFGLEVGGADTTQGALFFGGQKVAASITHCNISTAHFGTKLFTGSGLDLTFNNWFANETDITGKEGASADVSHGWFAHGAPPAGPATVTAGELSPTRLTDAGPR